MSNVNERKTRQRQGFDKPLVIASHFGFLPIDTPKVKDEDEKITSDCGPADPHYNASEKAAFLRTYLEKNLSSLPHPLGVAYKKAKAMSWSWSASLSVLRKLSSYARPYLFS